MVIQEHFKDCKLLELCRAAQTVEQFQPHYHSVHLFLRNSCRHKSLKTCEPTQLVLQLNHKQRTSYSREDGRVCILASGLPFITANVTFSLYKQLQCLQEKKILMTLEQGSRVFDLDLNTIKETGNPLQQITSA